MNSLEALFRPLRIKGLTLKNRLVYPSVVTGYGNRGLVGERTINFYGQRADGGAALIVVEPGKVEETNMNFMNLGIYNDAFLPGLSRLVARIHSGGALAAIQLHHTGRQGKSMIKGLPPLAPSPIPWSPQAERPGEMSRQDISHLIDCFARAAGRAKRAGFDLVEVHGAHGYLISEFLSPLSNRRTDEYGGSLGNRARFAIQVVRAVREEIGPDMPIAFRINGSDHMAGGFTLEEAAAVAPALVEAGVDLISVSSGVFGSYPTIIPPYDMDYGCNVGLAEHIKKSVNAPVTVAGRLNDLVMANQVIESGKADLIALARPLLADPELPDKARRGEPEAIRPCLACCHCVDGSYEEGGIQCTVNPALGKESDFVLSSAATPRKVLVIGGGPAGLEAARVAALRGHRVVLYEEEQQPGGQWLLASIPPGKRDFASLVAWEVRQLAALNVRVVTGKNCDPETVVREQPDAVIVATGARPVTGALKGFPPERTFTAWDVLGRKATPGKRILVIGGNALGLEVADFLSSGGNLVTVAEKLPHAGADMVSTVRFHLLTRLRNNGVPVLRSTEVVRADGDAVIAVSGASEVPLGAFDSIVLAVGAQPRNEIAGELAGKVKEIRVIGDALKPRRAIDAIREGAEAGMTV
ncbi:MAG: FAD-dependent oxidoreductase [Chloroflexi bacterium]|nr:FAD-dependent oxidoreductase [Chloroflexota bacterium]